MKLDWLKAFGAVMQTGTVTGATAVMLRTQPQVSRMISSLETSLGLALFQREGRRLIPTPEAVELFQHIEPVLLSIESVRDTAQDIKHKRGKPLVVTAEPFLLHALVPEAIQSLAKQSDFRCALDICVRGLGLWTSRSNVDLAVVALPFSQTDMSQILFAEVEVVAVLPQGHPLAERQVVEMEDLRAERFIGLRPSTLLRAQIDILAARSGFSINPEIEVASGVMACELVARGLGVTTADPIVAASFISQGVVLRRLSIGLQLPYGFLVPQEFPLGHPASRFMQALADAALRLGKPFVEIAGTWRKNSADGERHKIQRHFDLLQPVMMRKRK